MAFRWALGVMLQQKQQRVHLVFKSLAIRETRSPSCRGVHCLNSFLLPTSELTKDCNWIYLLLQVVDIHQWAATVTIHTNSGRVASHISQASLFSTPIAVIFHDSTNTASKNLNMQVNSKHNTKASYYIHGNNLSFKKRLLSLDKGLKAVLLISFKRRLSSFQKPLKHFDPELGKYVKWKHNLLEAILPGIIWWRRRQRLYF